MKVSTQIFLGFLVVLTLSTIDSISNYLLARRVEQNMAFLNNSQNIMRNSTKLHKSIIEMQNSFRGYLLTGDNDFLEKYNAGLTQVIPLFEQQERRLPAGSKQLPIMKSIQALHNKWIEEANTFIVAKSKGILNESPDVKSPLLPYELNKKIGKNLNDNLAAKFLEFDTMEYKKRKIHSNNLKDSIDNTHNISFMLLFLTIVVGIFSTLYIMRLISNRIQLMANQAFSISKGNFSIIEDKYNDEFSKLRDSLNIMSGILNKNISELEKRNAELDKFAHVVSHDLKAPLRGIHNVIKWIEEDLQSELSPEMKSYLTIIPQRTKRMEDLINGLLDYAMVRKVNVAEMTDINEMVAEIVDTVVPKNFKVETDKLPTFITEKLKLAQVFNNLINNAVKYNNKENGHILIKCGEHANYYEFSVKDNGIGIAPEYHKKIFEIFQTLRDKNDTESTGIGLAIVKKIIDEQHGTITVNSTLGNGCEFIFTWPKNNK